MVSTQTEIWWYNDNTWRVQESYQPTLARPSTNGMLAGSMADRPMVMVGTGLRGHY